MTMFAAFVGSITPLSNPHATSRTRVANLLPSVATVVKLSGWHMEGQYGPWTRLSWNNYKPKTDGNVATPAPAPQQQALPDEDSDIPF